MEQSNFGHPRLLLRLSSSSSAAQNLSIVAAFQLFTTLSSSIFTIIEDFVVIYLQGSYGF